MQLQNQFEQSVIKGLMDLKLNPTVMSCRVKVGEAVDLIAGQAVTMVDSAGGSPEVTAALDDADDIFGFVAYNQKQPSFSAGESLEIAFGDGSVMYLEASEAIARNGEVAIVVAGSKVKAAVATDRLVGRAIDKASGDGSLIRVLIILPGLIKA